MKKLILHSIFSRIEHGGLTVRFWDGEERRYGDEPPKVTVIFRRQPPATADLDDPMLTFGEFYMDEIIDFDGSMDEILRIMKMNMVFSNEKLSGGKVLSSAVRTLVSAADKLRQKQNIHVHYDLGNDFFSLWLDETLCYSCAYFRDPNDSLHRAQLQKIDLILKKLRPEPGQRLLDIGCGWGWLISQAARQYGVKATGITLSEEQYAGCKQRIEELGLTGQVDVHLVNYLDLDEHRHQYDRIVSVGMFEHVGRVNLPRYMEKVNRLLAPGGLSLLHTITSLDESEGNSWIQKYIFPEAYVPSLRETVWLLANYDFYLLHAESLRMHYARTLEHWYDNFIRKVAEVEAKFGRRFVRMWELYLTSCAASLRVGNIDIHQLLFSKEINNSMDLTLEKVFAKG